jgi:hypothetical protein
MVGHVLYYMKCRTWCPACRGKSSYLASTKEKREAIEVRSMHEGRETKLCGVQSVARFECEWCCFETTTRVYIDPPNFGRISATRMIHVSKSPKDAAVGGSLPRSILTRRLALIRPSSLTDAPLSAWDRGATFDVHGLCVKIRLEKAMPHTF